MKRTFETGQKFEDGGFMYEVLSVNADGTCTAKRVGVAETKAVEAVKSEEKVEEVTYTTETKTVSAKAGKRATRGTKK